MTTLQKETKKLQDGIRHALKKNDGVGLLAATTKLVRLKALLGEDDPKFLKQEAKVNAASESLKIPSPLEQELATEETEEPEQPKEPAPRTRSKSSAIETVRGLMKVAENKASTENEIHTALKKARKIMLENEIQKGDLEEDISGIAELVVLDRKSPLEKGTVFLFGAIASLFHCRTYVTRGSTHKLTIVGRKDMAAAAGEVFHKVKKNMTRKASQYCKENPSAGSPGWNSFCTGFAAAVQKRVDKDSKPSTDEKALVKVMDHEAAEYMNSLGLPQKVVNVGVNAIEYLAGEKEGKKANLGTDKIAK